MIKNHPKIRDTRLHSVIFQEICATLDFADHKRKQSTRSIYCSSDISSIAPFFSIVLQIPRLCFYIY